MLTNKTRSHQATMRRAMGGVAALVLSGLTLSGPSASAATTNSTCGYATTGQHASTICWLDLSGYNDSTARSAAGQDLTIALPGGGYTMSFHIQTTQISGPSASVASRTVPIETRFAFGEDAYQNIPGQPALYSSAHTSGVVSLDVNISNIVVRDASGTALTSYSFVAADAEDNVAGESFTWSSDKAIQQLESIDDSASGGCQPSGITGLGTSTVSCVGSGGSTSRAASGSSSRAILVAAAAPTSFDIRWQTQAQSGIAIGIQTASIQVIKQVTGRVNPGDSFDVSLASPQGTSLATATTGAANSASTGIVAVVPPTDGSPFTVSEAATGGSGADLSAYQHGLVCSRNGQADPSLPSGTATTGPVTVASGDAVVCTFTNAVPTVDTSMIGGTTGTIVTVGAITLTGAVVVACWRRRFRA